ILGEPFAEEVLFTKAGSIPLIVSISPWSTLWSQHADIILPGRLHSEKKATYTNKHGRVQRTETAIRAHHETRPEWMILTGLMDALEIRTSWNSTASVFDTMASEEKGFKDLNYAEIGSSGNCVKKPPEDLLGRISSVLRKTA
ncbi:MAG: molybdopterin-dependent oxidoreductase, partial [Dehalococcoidia bacterium]|nr:molybdopterin-dependent oxidoreductase [Dehalococcoidia bacterium]